ncbi:MAG: hypothetical protein DI552_09065 [Brevundimonas sp.]|uniref:hypothetical protein n=1 Tax=Brevundimonas TaxID=41275 RepID=UPI000DBBCFB9|nr:MULTISPECIES: hypothetical protein [Brevundimonas]PZU56742.1 MAG: hypothetical protein DI552_09065 [Brevundimonas sp.]UQV17105.1 hypothetical protein MU852_08890 [Brevundimonas albigilva]
MPTAYHMVHYRRFNTGGVNIGSETFESACRTALGQANAGGQALWERAQDRLLDLGGSDGGQLVLNRVADLESAVFGEMCLVQNHGLQALLQLRAQTVQLSNITTAEIFGLDERAAPAGSQFVRGMAYWLAIGDHVLFVKTQSMTSDLFRQYMDWLLKQQTGTLGQNVPLNFQAEFDKAQVAGDIGDVRSLRISGKSVPQLTVVPSDTPERDRTVATSRKVAEKYAVFEQAKTLAEVVFGKAKTESLVESMGPEEFLSAETTFKVQGRRTERSREVMKELANELADTTDAMVQVEGKFGRVSDDDAILRTRMPFDIEADTSNLLNFDNVADQLQVTYQRFVDDGKIPAA